LKTDTITSITADTNLTLNAAGTGGIRIGTGFGVFQQTAYDLGTNASGTETLSAVNGNIQSGINGGAHTLAPQAQLSTIEVQYTNNGSAGTITTSGYTYVTGDTYDLTDGSKYILTSTVTGSSKQLHVSALQGPPSTSGTYLSSFTEGTNATTFTESGVAFGAAASNRRIVCAIASDGGSTGNITGCTLGGVTATAHVIGTMDGERTAAIFSAIVPTGTTGDVVVVHASSKGSCASSVYRLINAAIVDTATVSNVASAASSLAITPTAGNFAVAVMGSSASSRTYTWSANMTEDFDGTQEGTGTFTSASAAFGAGDATVTCTPSGSTSTDTACIATFGPV
jgi:hypothetical protein